MATRLERGFVGDYPEKRPPKSAKGFEWPGRDAPDVVRMAFQKNLTRHIRARGENHREFARSFLGETRDSKGFVIPRTPGTILKYLSGESFPTPDRARQFAAFFKVPMDALLQDDGTPVEPIALIRPRRATAATRRKMNGHGSNGHAHPDNGGHAAAVLVQKVSPGAPAREADTLAQLPPRPADSKPAQLHVDALPDAPDYCNISITGTVRYDTAMALVSLVGRDQHGLGPRK